MEHPLPRLLAITLFGLLAIAALAIWILASAGIAWFISYCFENWLTWCKINPTTLRTLIVTGCLIGPPILIISRERSK